MEKQLRLFVPETQYYNLLKEYQAIDLASADVAVSFASVKDSSRGSKTKTNYQKLQLAPLLAQRFRLIVANTVANLLDRLEDGGTVIEYEAGTGADDDVFEHTTLTPGGKIAEQLEPLTAPWDLEPFKERKEFVANLRYYVVSLRRSGAPDDEILHAFRFFTDSFELHRTRWVATLQGHGDGYYDEVEEPGFLFDYQIDCLCRGEHIFILNRDKFQRIFRFYEHVQQDAKDFVYSLQGRIPIANLEEFLAACKRDPRMAMKLADLAEQPHVGKLSMTRIKRAIEQRGLAVRTTEQDGREMLVYATAYKAEFLSLLSDDYLRSPMTLLDYQARSKRALKPVGGKSASVVNMRRHEESEAADVLPEQPEPVPDVTLASLRKLPTVDPR